MRTSFRVGPVGLAAILAASLLGCGGSDSDGGGTTTGDSSVSDTSTSGDGAKIDSTSTSDTASASDTTTTDGTSSDTTASDGTATDTTSTDTATTTDAVKSDGSADTAPAKCTTDGDCRKFSSYCDGTVLKLCTCVPLGKGDPDPVCDGTKGTCFVDPCKTKTARCGAGNVCVVE